jgi:ParB-like chromosome segregation protein Spo0J
MVKSAKRKKAIAVHCSHQKMVAIDQLKPNPENPNSHPDGQVDKLAAIIKAHGWRHPITVSNRSGYIVSGHCRRAAAEKLGLVKCPVDFQDFKSKAEERAVLLADNVIAELAEINAEKMSDIIAALEKARYDLDLTALTAEQIGEHLSGPNFLPVSEEEQPRLDEKTKVKCPECGCEFTP